jgi:hypothetical protein
MSLKYGILIFLFLIIIALLALKNYGVWNHTIDLSPEKGFIKKSDSKTESPPTMGSSKKPISIESYIFIAEKNIFSPERKEFPIIASSSPMAEFPKKPIARPQIILYGVMISDDYQLATIVNQSRPPKKGEREMMTLKIGEQIGEYKLSKILPDRIIFEAPEDTLEVLLYDPKTPKKRSDIKTASKPATVTSSIASSTSAPDEIPKPTPVKETTEKPKEPVQERVATPPQLPIPTTPSNLPPATRRGRTPIYPPTGVPPPEPPATGAPPVGPLTPGYPTPGTSTQETGET